MKDEPKFFDKYSSVWYISCNYLLKQKSLATHHRYAYILQKSTLKFTQTK